MGESLAHVRLVQEIIDWISSRDSHAVILADTSIFNAKDRPPVISGHIPDVFARVDSLQRTIIGEAKTRKDLENEHTMSQFRAYSSYCKYNPETLLILAVPWEMRRFVHNLFNRLKNENNLQAETIVVLDCFIN